MDFNVGRHFVMVGLILKRNFSLTLRFSHVLTFALVDSTYLSLCMHFRMAKKTDKFTLSFLIHNLFSCKYDYGTLCYKALVTTIWPMEFA